MVASSSKKQYNWKQDAIGFGVFIYICNTIVIPYLTGFEITLIALLTSLPIHALAAVGYGRTMKWWHKQHKLRKEV